MRKRLGTSRHTFHSTDMLHDSLEATLHLERLIEQHGQEWIESVLTAMARRPERARRAIGELVDGIGRG